MESEDYHFYQGLVYLLENDVSTLGYDLTFSTEVGQEILTVTYPNWFRKPHYAIVLELTLDNLLIFLRKHLDVLKSCAPFPICQRAVSICKRQHK